MEKLNMQTPNLVDENIEKIGKLFPDSLTERTGADGKVEKAIDFDKLKQELSKSIVQGDDERYQFTWPGKKQAIITANAPINKTLRPCQEESVDFDNTQNLYIEGDNLDVLKLLREDYLGKVKMIYIDPPYNTGNDFVYEDDFAQSTDDYIENSGQKDDDGNRLVANTENNGRFHTDWLNMIYPRLKVARDFLSDAGVIFISIDEHEVHNMRKLTDEIFGEVNFISLLGWQKVYSPKNQARYFSNDYEFILCYAKNINSFHLNMLPRTEKMNARYKNPDNDPRGDWKAGDCVGNGVRKNGYYDVINPKTGKKFNVPQGKHWVYAPENMKKLIEDNRIWFGKDGDSFPAVKQFLSDVTGRRPSSMLLYEDYGHTDMAKKDLIKLFPELEKVPFDTPKPVKLVKMLSILGSNENDIILDFFAGSGTTAQSLFELNAETASNRKFILVQIPESLNDNPMADSEGLKTISDVCMERIRRAGNKVLKDLKEQETDIFYKNKKEKIDVGFRVLKLSDSNMKDTYYTPRDVNKDIFSKIESNIKEDRNDEDLLFQVMLEMSVPLSAKISSEKICGKKVLIVDDDYLIACFDNDITDEVVTDIAKRKPQYFVMRDSSASDDSVITNFETIFQTYSKDTVRKIL